MLTKHIVLDVIRPFVDGAETVSTEQYFAARETVREWLSQTAMMKHQRQFNGAVSKAWSAIENGDNATLSKVYLQLTT